VTASKEPFTFYLAGRWGSEREREHINFDFGGSIELSQSIKGGALHFCAGLGRRQMIMILAGRWGSEREGEHIKFAFDFGGSIELSQSLNFCAGLGRQQMIILSVQLHLRA